LLFVLNKIEYVIFIFNQGMTGRQLKVCLGDIENKIKCVVKPVFGYPVDVVATYCSTHKKDGMIDIFNKKCEFIHPETKVKCTKQKTHNFLEVYDDDGTICSGEPKFCSEHAENGMLNLLIKRCVYAGCLVIPSYNYENMPSGIYCYTHKKENMVPVANSSLCGVCSKRASYNFRGKKTVLYCEEHAEPGMVNVTRGMCLYVDGCDKQARERDLNTGKFSYCTNHFKILFPGKPTAKQVNRDKKQDIANKKFVLSSLDLEDKLQVSEDETNIGIVNNENVNTELISSPIETKDIVSSITTKLSSIEINDCKQCLSSTKPTYEVDGMVRPISIASLSALQNKMKGFKAGVIKVESTAPEGIDVRLAKKTCKNIGCLEPGHMNYDRYCRSCFMVLFPEDERIGKYKCKELCVRDFIKKEFPNVTLMCDRKVIDGCSKRRPDLLIDLGYQVICIEVDENQHARYEEICENKRMMEIFEDIGRRPLIFIRFNPDSYYKGKIKISSCWGPSKKIGAQVVKKSSELEWEKRLTVLRNQVAHWLDEKNKTDKELTCVYLFFDASE
jgi:hypothetical protein